MLVERKAGVVVPDPLEDDKLHDMELVVPLQLIREHCKLDDVEGVSDAMLKLYRSAAVETAEKYTGLMLHKKCWITELVEHPDFSLSRQRWFEYSAQYMFANPMGYYYGFTGMAPQQVGLKLGTNKARLPIIANDFGLGCCNPCNTPLQEKFMYMAGYDCEKSFPAAFILGALKYIAHVVENPGDVASASLGTGGTTARYDLSSGSNPAVASGAIEIWRTIRSDAI